MRIVFDPDFDSGCWPGPLGARDAVAGEAWVGPGGLLGTLETALGLAAPPVSTTERAARLMGPLRDVEGFWSRSVEVDPFGSARRLLSWCDTLAMCGWTGGGDAPRLAQLAALVAQAPQGFAGRLVAVNLLLPKRDACVESVTLLSPRDDLEPLWRATLRLLDLLVEGPDHRRGAIGLRLEDAELLAQTRWLVSRVGAVRQVSNLLQQGHQPG